MSSVIDTSSYSTLASQALANDYATESLQKKLGSTDATTATDDELLEACKSFESYFVEQVIKEMRKTVHAEEDDNEYMQYFGDTLYQKYAEAITESGQLGLAQQLYDSMKVQASAVLHPVTGTEVEE